jgi:hypothetical protein
VEGGREMVNPVSEWRREMVNPVSEFMEERDG